MLKNKRVLSFLLILAALFGTMVYRCSGNKIMIKERTSAYPVDALIMQRWSPYNFSGEAITEKELMTIFEAARFAPSSYNEQPWRFIYAHRDTPEWTTLFNLLVPFNQQWTRNAAVLVAIISHNIFDRNNELNSAHSFDTGASWQNMALQAHAMGLATHGMKGFDHEKARTTLHIPDDYTVEAMAAIGKIGNQAKLPEGMRPQEKRSERKPVSELIFKGTFKQE